MFGSCVKWKLVFRFIQNTLDVSRLYKSDWNQILIGFVKQKTCEQLIDARSNKNDAHKFNYYLIFVLNLGISGWRSSRQSTLTVQYDIIFYILR